MQISPNLHFQVILQVDLWPWFVTCWPHEHMKVPIFKWGHFLIFSLSYNLTSDELWPWYVTFDLINKWGFPCCINDPTLVDIHQSMWKLEPNVNPFSQQQTTTTDNRGQSDPYVSFLLRQVTQKPAFHYHKACSFCDWFRMRFMEASESKSAELKVVR